MDVLAIKSIARENRSSVRPGSQSRPAAIFALGGIGIVRTPRQKWLHTYISDTPYAPHMEMLRVDPGSVRAMALRLHVRAGELGASTPPIESSCHPSVAAVIAGHAAVATAAESLTGRVQASAAKVAAGDASYINNEATSAAELAAVADPLRGW